MWQTQFCMKFINDHTNTDNDSNNAVKTMHANKNDYSYTDSYHHSVVKPLHADAINPPQEKCFRLFTLSKWWVYGSGFH